MNLLEVHDATLRIKLTSLPVGTEFGLSKLFGTDWAGTGTPGQRREFGRLFKEAIRNGAYPAIEWIRIENSGRYDVYRKNC